MQFYTPLRYPGGKGKLTEFIRRIFVDNDLVGGHYAEPYAGGAGIAMSLLALEYVSHVHLNDLNKSIYSFWYSVLYHTDALCEMIEKCPVTMDEWYLQRAVQDETRRQSRLALGFSTFFLNRANRSGIIRGGVIGGKEQGGKWKLDARFNKPDLIARIKWIASYSDRISLSNKDAEDFVGDLSVVLPKRSLIYLDPPYYVKGQGLYEDHYNHEDHLGLASTVSAINVPWIVSYDNAPEIRAMYKDYTTITYGLNYSAQSRYVGSEVMFFRPGLEIPDVENPSKLKAA